MAQDDFERSTNEEPQQREAGGRMNRRAVLLTIALFLLIVAGMFIFAFTQQSDDDMTAEDENIEEETEDRYAGITRIEGTHFYIDGVHTVVGEVTMPTPCDLLETSARVAESAPEQITLEFDVVNNAEFCAQVETPARFKVSASASPEATFDAIFEGRDIELNLVEAEEGETPEDFELYIKG